MSSRDAGYSDVSVFLFELETEQQLWTWEIDGFRVWDYIRAPLQRKLYGKIDSRGDTEPSDETGLRTYLKGLSLWGRNLVSRNPLFGSCKVLSYGTGRRKRLSDGVWWDIYFDPIYTQTDLDYLHIDQHFKNEHRTPAKTENLAYNDFIHYSGTICHKMGLFSPDLSSHDAEIIAEIERRIEEEFDVTVTVASIIERKYREARAREPLYKLLLSRVEPEIALLTCSYGRESFVKACQDKNVPVVELQHGAIDPYHPGYVFPGESTKSIYPDYFFVWGEFWKENIEFPIPDENVIVTGYPYMSDQASKYDSLEDRDQVIIISQPKAGTKLSTFAIELAEDDRISADIVYKLHPKEYGDWEERYPELKETNLAVVDSDDPPLYQLLAQSSTLIGAFSTVVYEGFKFDLDTFLLDVSGSKTMEHITDLENVHVIDTVDEFVEQYRTGTTPVRAEKFFAENPVNNIERAIDTIRNRSSTDAS